MLVTSKAAAILSQRPKHCIPPALSFVCSRFVHENGGNPYRETTLYIIHGLLHLLGYDDQDDESRLIMRAQEKSAMLYLEESKETLDAV